MERSARDIERLKPGEISREISAIQAQALFEIGSTFGIPNPPDDTSLSLGVAALARFLAAFPGHPQAVKAAYSVGASYLARGKSAQALDAFSQFLKPRDSRSSPTSPVTTGPSSRWPPRSRSARFFRARGSSPRRSPPGRVTWRSFPTDRKAPTPSGRFSTPSS